MDNEFRYRFARKEDEEVQVSLRDFKDKLYIDLRIFYQPKDGGDMRPTRKGITLELDRLSELKKGISACEKRIEMMRTKPTEVAT